MQAADTTQEDVRDRDAAPAVRTPVSLATTSPAKVDRRDTSPGSGGAEDTIIYSNNAPDVEPAVLVDPERLPDAVHATNGIDAGNMELIISETGIVSSLMMNLYDCGAWAEESRRFPICPAICQIVPRDDHGRSRSALVPAN